MNQKTLFSLCLWGAILSSALQAQNGVVIDRSAFSPEQVIDVSLSPVADNKYDPRFALVPGAKDSVDRNAALCYYRAIRHADSQPTMPEFADRDDVVMYNRMSNCPLSEFPVTEVKAWLSKHSQTLLELEHARRSNRIEWGILPEPGEDDQSWYQIEPQELQDLRILSRMLSIKARLEMSEGRIADAVKTIQTNFKIGYDVGKSKLVVGDLVGFSIQRAAAKNVLEIIQQTDCPNLYWQLAGWFVTKVECRDSILLDLELILDRRKLKTLDDPLSQRLTEEQWRKQLFSDFENVWNLTSTVDPKASQAMITGLLMRGYPIAKKALLDAGMDEATVTSMPVIQVIAAYEYDLYREFLDEARKLDFLPLHEVLNTCEHLEGVIETQFESFKPGASILPLTGAQMPAISYAFQAECRSHNQIAALQIVEAIRSHVGDTGKFPAALGDIKNLPLPNNAFSGEPFHYEKTERGANLYVFGKDLRDSRSATVYDLTIGENQ